MPEQGKMLSSLQTERDFVLIFEMKSVFNLKLQQLFMQLTMQSIENVIRSTLTCKNTIWPGFKDSVMNRFHVHY